MKMVSVERTAEQEKTECAPPMHDKYPYGLRMYIDNDTMKKLGISDLPTVGMELKLEAFVKVCSVSMNESESGKYKSCDIQVVEMALEKPRKDYAKVLYDKES